MKRRRSISRWITRCFVIILVVSMIASALANLYGAYVRTVEYGTQFAQLCAENITDRLDRDWPLDDMEDEDGSVFRGSRQALIALCDAYELDYLFLYGIDPESGARYLYSFATNDMTSENYLRFELLHQSRPAGRLLDQEQALLDGARDIRQGFTRTEFGRAYTWTAPYVKDGELRAMIGMSIGTDSMVKWILESFAADVLPFAAALFLGLMILLLLVRRRIVLPIDAISESMKRFAREGLAAPGLPDIRRGDEIGEIAHSYEKMTEDIGAYIGSIEKLTRERVEYDVQMDVARRIQNGLVPERTVLNGSGYAVCAMTEPARAVGGDFYDCFRRGEGGVCVVMGDVSGKGVSAAIFMAMIRTVIRQKLALGLDPAEALKQTNGEICAQNPENLFATAFAAVLDPSTGVLRYANAGHNYPVLMQEKPYLMRPDPGIALGMFEDAEVEDASLVLREGEGILLYTDGVTEAADAGKAFFGTDRLLEAVKGVCGKENRAEEAVDKAARAVHAFRGGAEPFDDMALLALFREGGADPDEGRVPAKDEAHALPLSLCAFDAVRESVTAAVGDTPPARRALLACDEWISNVVSYSRAERFEFVCASGGEGVRVVFRDDGIPFDPTKVPDGAKDFEDLDRGGMGLHMIRQSASRMEYARRDGMNELTLLFSGEDGNA